MTRYDSQLQLTAACFALFVLIVAIAVAYSYGVTVGEAHCHIIYPPIQIGPVPDGVPVMAIYIDDGVLYGTSALSTNGTLRAFNVYGGSVDFEPIDSPDAWVTLSAEWSKAKVE